MLLKNSLFIFLLLSLTLLWSCDFLGGDDPEPEEPNTELEKLPPATQTGENTFGCLVNGKAWVPTGCFGSTAGADFFWPNFFTLEAQWECPDESIGMFITGPEGGAITTQTYPIISSLKKDEYEYWGGGGFNGTNECDYINTDNKIGTITIRNLDKPNKIVSGTFEFSTWKEGCDTVRVTDGRFDFRYIN